MKVSISFSTKYFLRNYDRSKISQNIFFAEDEDSEEEALYTDAYEGMKLRSKSRHGSGEENGR